MSNDVVQVSPWTPLSYKSTLVRPEQSLVTPTWFPDPTDPERISAYYTLSLYLANAARSLLGSESARGQHREYGDPALLRDRVVSGVLGSDWAVSVDGAGDDLSRGPSLPPPPSEPDADASPLDERIYNARLAAWEAAVEETLSEWEALVEGQPAARQAQRDLRKWMTRRQVDARIVEATQTEVGLGDSVMVLWPQEGDWPKLSVVQPDGYFPVLSDDDAADFPDRVDIAWDFLVEEPGGGSEVFVRRFTWQLVPISDMRTGTVDGETVWIDAEGAPSATPLLGETETLVDTADGAVVGRWYPWHTDTDDPSLHTCLFSEGVWRRTDITTEKLRDFPTDRAEWVHYNRDLNIDFIPVVHTPNTPASQTTWGQSSLANVLQVLDDVALHDRDVMQATRYLSNPTIFAKGVQADVGDQVMPGRLMKTGSEQGGMDVLDLSAGVPELLAAADRLEDRLWQVAGMPAELVGRVDEDSGVSGVAIMLRYAPFAQTVGTLRMARESKHRLMLKFAYRLAQAAGAVEPGPSPAARITYGSFLPSNRSETVELVAQARQAQVMSTQTAVLMLVAAGFPVDDATDEVDRINRENTEAARNIADATGSEQAAADYLGIELPDTPFLPLPEIEIED